MFCWQDFEWVLAMMPMFLFSTTFFPLGVYPRPLQVLVELTPLYQGTEITGADARRGRERHGTSMDLYAVPGCS